MTGVIMKGWISLQDNCAIDYHICGEFTEFVLGGFGGPEIVTTERGLAALLAKGTEALERMRARSAETDDLT